MFGSIVVGVIGLLVILSVLLLVAEIFDSLTYEDDDDGV